MTQHLIIVPIVLPLVTAALLVLPGARSTRVKGLVSLAAALLNLVVAVELLRRAAGTAGTITVYLASNWEAPFGIVLVADRLAVLMLVVTGIIALCAALYAEAGWARAGVYYHPLFQVALMGLNGAFLTGDLFNLFVFFEVTLAASYGLQLHGSGPSRVRSGLHYLVVNLLGSSLFLIGLALLYGVMGSLSMADIAAKLPSLPESERGLLHAGAAILSVAFLIKAAIWPLNAWLAPAYAAASAPVAAMFALMTKVGVYALVRVWTLLFPATAGASAFFGGTVMLYLGLATIAVGAVGLMASIHLNRIACFSIIVSSGTLLSAIALGGPAMTSAALFYLVSATLAASALFLLVELVDRMSTGRVALAEVEAQPDEDTNLDDEEVPLVGRPFPVSIALLGLAFIASALLVAGLPPLSGFVAKVLLLSAALDTDAGGPGALWILGLLLVYGLAATITLSRAGIRYFWSTRQQLALRLKPVEAAAVVMLIGACVLLTRYAEPVLRYTNATAEQLSAPDEYIRAVMSAEPQPGPTRPDVTRPAAP